MYQENDEKPDLVECKSCGQRVWRDYLDSDGLCEDCQDAAEELEEES